MAVRQALLDPPPLSCHPASRSTVPLSEADTRVKLIDPNLKLAGWGESERKQSILDRTFRGEL